MTSSASEESASKKPIALRLAEDIDEKWNTPQARSGQPVAEYINKSGERLSPSAAEEKLGGKFCGYSYALAGECVHSARRAKINHFDEDDEKRYERARKLLAEEFRHIGQEMGEAARGAGGFAAFTSTLCN